jgi:hypothetical protein
VMHRPASAASFIAAERPVEALGRFTRCALSPSSSHVITRGLFGWQLCGCTNSAVLRRCVCF